MYRKLSGICVSENKYIDMLKCIKVECGRHVGIRGFF